MPSTKLLKPKFVAYKLGLRPILIQIATFPVGPYEYKVFETDEVYETRRGRKVSVTALWLRRELSIWVRKDLQLDDKLVAIEHELKHAWRCHFPPSHVHEEAIEWQSSFARWFTKEAQRQGLI